MPREMWVHFRLVVECGECEDADEAWDIAVDALRKGGGEIVGHTITDANGAIEDDYYDSSLEATQST